MPIKKGHEYRYGPRFDAAKKIVAERSGGCCELCGVANGARIVRDPMHPAKFKHSDGEGSIKIVLTTAHLDPAYDERLRYDPRYMLRLCQRCHFLIDKAVHWAARQDLEYLLVKKNLAV